MAFSTTDIITWAKISEPLALIGEAKKLATTGACLDKDLFMKIRNIRANVEYEYSQDSSSDLLFGLGNLLYDLCVPYVFQAQSLAGSGGGSVTPVTPGGLPTPIEFEVTASSYIANGESSRTISSFIGYNLIFVRGNITQSTINVGGSYFSWNRTTGLFQCSPAAVTGELFQLYPVS